MKSETRANWIFLGLFMLVMGPGLIILTKKAYKKGAAGMSPPAPQSASMYNDPNPQNPALPRIVPPATSGFIDALTQRMTGLQPDLKPLQREAGKSAFISENRSIECVALGGSDGKQHIALIGWHKKFAPLPSRFRFTANRDGLRTEAKMIAYEQQNLPLSVRAELQRYGYLLPPDSVLWIILEVDGNELFSSIDLHFELDGKSLDDHLALPPPVSR